MKKLISVCFVLTVVTSFSAAAQFHVEVGISLNAPSGNFGKVYESGMGIYIEPKYAICNKLDLGVYVGSHAFAPPTVVGGALDEISLIPILATGTYRFSSEKFTIYAGLGIGLYYDAPTTFFEEDPVTGATISVKEEGISELGLAPRAGIYFGKINLGLTYNSVRDFNFVQANLGVRILSRE